MRRCKMQATNDGLRGIRPYLCKLGLQALAGTAKCSKRVINSDRPVGACHDLASSARATIQPGLMQSECKLDNVRNVFFGYSGAFLVFECLCSAASGQESGLEVLLTDDAE